MPSTAEKIGWILFVSSPLILIILGGIVCVIEYLIGKLKIKNIKKRKRIYLFDNNFYKEDEQWQKDYAQALKKLEDVK